MNSTKPLLLVEDDLVDAMTVERAVRDLKIKNEFVHRSDGEKALAYLDDSDNRIPCLILLDLNMPRMNGIEFLESIRHDENYSMIPVIVLTSSDDDRDKVESFRLGIAGYMLKPVDYKQFVEMIRAIDLYWTLSEFPPLE